MEKRIEPKVLLSAAEKVRSCGIRDKDSYVLELIYLDVSFDGYTLTLRDSKTSITLLFHNTIKADYKKLSDLEEFYKRLKGLSQRD